MKKRFIVIFTSIIVLLLLIVMFLWQEKLSINAPINAEKFSAFATLIASLLTAVTVYLLFRQIDEQINDRKANNQPDLYPTQVILETHDTTVSYDSGKGSYVYPQFFRTNNPNTDIKQSSPRVFCSLHNIGLGSAKEIWVKWDYSMKEVETYIDNVYLMKGYSVDAGNQNFDFLAANNFLEIEMPETYMRSCGQQLNKRDIEKTRTITDLKAPLKLIVEFLDIYNNSYKKVFKVSFLVIFTNVYITLRQDK